MEPPGSTLLVSPRVADSRTYAYQDFNTYIEIFNIFTISLRNLCDNISLWLCVKFLTCIDFQEGCSCCYIPSAPHGNFSYIISLLQIQRSMEVCCVVFYFILFDDLSRFFRRSSVLLSERWGKSKQIIMVLSRIIITSNTYCMKFIQIKLVVQVQTPKTKGKFWRCLYDFRIWN